MVILIYSGIEAKRIKGNLSDSRRCLCAIFNFFYVNTNSATKNTAPKVLPANVCTNIIDLKRKLRICWFFSRQPMLLNRCYRCKSFHMFVMDTVLYNVSIFLIIIYYTIIKLLFFNVSIQILLEGFHSNSLYLEPLFQPIILG